MEIWLSCLSTNKEVKFLPMMYVTVFSHFALHRCFMNVSEMHQPTTYYKNKTLKKTALA